MIHLDDAELRRLQETELEILIEIDRICRKNNIKYSLTGGTLLGAVRHNGFIPWDDDADISMLREEYRKFQKACCTDLDKERFYFQDMETTEGYRWGYGKVRRKNTVFLREHQEDMPYEQGMFVDVFPRDGIPDGVIMGQIHRFLCYVLRKLMWSAVGKKTASGVLCRMWYQWMYWICSREKILLFYQKLIRWSNHSPTKLVRALTFPLPNGVEGYERDWYRDYIDIEFDGYVFQAEAGYRKWLAREFGDYMKLPPPEKRKTHPVTQIQFPVDDRSDEE